jgi:hypothetical protein
VSFVAAKHRIDEHLHKKAAAMRAQIESRFDRILLCWFIIAGLACALRVAMTPLREPLGFGVIFPYLLLVCAPVASATLALRWFADGEAQPQPRFRLSIVGKWRTIDREDAPRYHLYGAGGVMVSLLVGMLVNVPFRAIEYLGAMPAVSGKLPAWLSVLHMMMTLDVVMMTSLYAIAFVAALRHVPLFPRLLVAIWGLDLAMQLMTAELVAGTPGLPPAVADALHNLLDGNVKKVLISVALWLPYLLLSRRVNLTYRSRVPA